MLASESCPNIEFHSQEPEHGQKHETDLENCGIDLLFNDLDHCDLIDNRTFLWSAIDPYFEGQTYADVLDIENQGPIRLDYVLNSKTEDEYHDKSTEYLRGSGGIGQDNSGIGPVSELLRDPEEDKYPSFESYLMDIPKYDDRNNEAGTFLRNPGKGMPLFVQRHSSNRSDSLRTLHHLSCLVFFVYPPLQATILLP
jgi:hypothetical protein